MNIEQMGLGTDILEVHRMELLLSNKRFLHRVFTQQEQEYVFASSIPAQTAAGLFCAKEAVIKALDAVGEQVCHWTDLEVHHTPTGRPWMQMAGKEALHIQLSISHCKTYATATALIWKK